ncbi:DUF4476 domain-containing protein [Myxococcus qinghaiensis]|uniref:DUF4476 domain-containing protein n=1 Tax=Myxococcus qinghaiensis TaxID=2906758 RepID=UPI0020A80E3B|nr:DUF4476 domain-containing protein [Myxococcus qinghaiensis]MCP3162506.1 DUF4476 domain-containing protein [Myxococcus qinghaiensis]
MKALAIAVALLTSATSFAQTSPQVEKQQAPDATMEKFRPPPSGRPMPQQPAEPPRHNNSGPFVPPNSTGTLVVVSREDLAQRLERLERLMEDIEDRADRDTRSKVRKAQEQLESVRRQVTDAPLLATVMPRPPPPPPEPMIRPMADGSFQRWHDAIARENFTDDKLRVLNTGLQGNYLLVSQVMRLMERFSFNDDKINVLRAVKSRILDTENNYQLYNAFQFSADKKRAQDILSSR